MSDIVEILQNTTPVFGLEAQGHIPLIERMLAAGESWPEIGKAIGWDAETARAHYERYKERQTADLITRLRAEVQALQQSCTYLTDVTVPQVRAEAFERAAQIAENTSFMMPIDWWMQSSKKEVSVESCLQVAAAIRQAGSDKT